MPLMSAGQKSLSAASNGSLGSYPNLGMSMRFSVQVRGLESPPGLPSHEGNLGLWQSCKNLQMELQYKKFAQGASLVDAWLPERLAYSPVTLERPMEAASSAKVREWLDGRVADWNAYPAGKPKSTEVIITLLDHQLNKVMEWTLVEARPSKWTGPSLSATDNKVAIETLVIDHSGFLSESPAAEPSRAILSVCTDDGGYENLKGTRVEFKFNPKTLQITHSSKTRNGSTDGTPGFANLIDLGIPSLSLPSLTFDGADTLDACETLLDWSYAKQRTGSKEIALPDLVFAWGEFAVRKTSSIKVTLTKVEITYERFDAKAKPTRASVSLDLEPVETGTQKQQNPTSGGLPGRAGHLMVAGDTLQRIALDRYGDPAGWRALAAANQIDDPLRMRPGAALYLPDRGELRDPGAP